MNSNIPGVNPDSSLPSFTFIVSKHFSYSGTCIKVRSIYPQTFSYHSLPRLTFPVGQKKYFIKSRTYSPPPPGERL